MSAQTPTVSVTIPESELVALRRSLRLAQREAAAWKGIAEHGCPELCAKVRACIEVHVEIREASK